jgi:DNA topoisomerase-3
MFSSGKTDRVSIGVCPRCGTAVFESKKNFYCENRDCTFVMWKNDRFFTDKKKTLTSDVAAVLLKEGRAHIKGLHSKNKNVLYDADILLSDTGKYVNYRICIHSDIDNS